MQGFIKIHRKFLEWEWATEPNMTHFLLYCILKANWEDDSWKGKMINRGQFTSGIYELSSESGLTVQQVRTCIKRLVASGEITVKSTNKYTLYTIVKYEKFQHDPNKLTNEQQTNNKQITNEQQQLKEVKEDKEVKEKNKTIQKETDLFLEDNFTEFWEVYPRKIDKKKAKAAYATAIKDSDPNEIFLGASCYFAYCVGNKTEQQHIKHPTTWLNGNCWENEYAGAENVHYGDPLDVTDVKTQKLYRDGKTVKINGVTYAKQ